MKNGDKRGSGFSLFKAAVILLNLAALLVFVSILLYGRNHTPAMKHSQEKETVELTELTLESTETTETTEAVEMTQTINIDYVEEDVLSFNPSCTDETEPSNYINSRAVCVNGTTLSAVSDYSPSRTISFDKGSEYTDVEGIVTFRGNNYRDNPAYGLAEMTEYTLENVWSQNTGSLTSGSHVWSGNGWTGQPLMMKWPRETKAHMNMYDWAKEDDDLVEVIYASMDGYIYFMDLETGKKTRDDLWMGYTFKGAGALDPRGYPILYVGAGYTSELGKARVFVINLLDCSVMYTFGNDDSFAFRSVSFFDSSCLIDAETDTMIYPGENGILYLIHLNSQYDEAAGTVSIDPDETVKWHYQGVRTTSEKYWIGMEDSAAVYEGYLFIADNGGNLMCMNLNTLQLVWVQDTLDDSNSTPVLSVEDGHLYIYVSTSFHLGWRSNDTATVPIWKIDAEDGSIVWQTDYTCYSVDGASGGVQSTIALGRYGLDDNIYVTVGRTGSISDGVLACLDKKTGAINWEHVATYAWSSPVCVYNSDGTGAVLYCACNGKMYLLNGLTGDTYSTAILSDGAIEASPAVYNDMAVIGTRAGKIWGIRLN